MKNMMIAASALGVLIAGIIIARSRNKKPVTAIRDAASDAYNTMNRGIGLMERNPHHVMG